eukprot:4887362-Amphidinium_carterae.2
MSSSPDQAACSLLLSDLLVGDHRNGVPRAAPDGRALPPAGLLLEAKSANRASANDAAPLCVDSKRTSVAYILWMSEKVSTVHSDQSLHGSMPPSTSSAGNSRDIPCRSLLERGDLLVVSLSLSGKAKKTDKPYKT